MPVDVDFESQTPTQTIKGPIWTIDWSGPKMLGTARCRSGSVGVGAGLIQRDRKKRWILQHINSLNFDIEKPIVKS